MLIRPSALPDEVGDSYKGRLMRLNGVADEKMINRRLLDWAGPRGASLREIPMVELLAKAAGMDTISFVRAHTMVPLRRSIASVYHDRPHGHADRGSNVLQKALRLCRPEAYFCEDCVSEDFEFHGWVYWKREHQLPGLDWCRKHGSPLRSTAEFNALLRSPSDFLSYGSRVSKRHAVSPMRSAAIDRFIAIESQLLNQDMPIDAGAASSMVRRLAKASGLCVGVSRTGRVRLLSDMLGDTFGGEWLCTVIPSFKKKVSGQYCHPIDKAVDGARRHQHWTVFVAAVAALFDDADTALSALLGSASDDNEVKPSDVDLYRVYARWWGIGDERARDTAFCEQGSTAQPGDLLRLIERVPLSDRCQALQRYAFDQRPLRLACEGNDDLQRALDALIRMTVAQFVRGFRAPSRHVESVVGEGVRAVGVKSTHRGSSRAVPRKCPG